MPRAGSFVKDADSGRSRGGGMGLGLLVPFLVSVAEVGVLLSVDAEACGERREECLLDRVGI